MNRRAEGCADPNTTTEREEIITESIIAVEFVLGAFMGDSSTPQLLEPVL